MKRFIIICIIYVFLLTSCTLDESENLINEPETSNVVVLPHVELLTGVLAIANGKSYRGPVEDGNGYYRELIDFLDNHKDHSVFETSRKLSALGLTYEAPYAFILHYASIDDLSNDIQYNDYVIYRGVDEELLREFALELYNLAQESDFYDEFYLKHIDLYSSLQFDIDENMKWTEIDDFMTEIYGELHNKCITVVAPAAFSFGGYSVHLQEGEEDIFYNILRSNSYSNDDVDYDMSYITPITLHEWSHVYVNPVVDEILERLIAEGMTKELTKLYEPVDKQMMDNGYTNLDQFFDEQIIRGITLLFFDKYMSEEDFQKELRQQEAVGFYLTEYTYKVVKEYMISEDRGSYAELIEELIEGYMRQ